VNDTVWTQRAAGQQVSNTNEGKDSDELDEVALVVVDPSLSPNWLRLPPELGGMTVRVDGSCWLPLAPNPQWEADGRVWLEQRTRWHVLRGMPLVVAEVVGHGWVVVDVGPERRAWLRELCGLPAEAAVEVWDA
jgi:hypothetical protein